jgi:hypothetical protein
VPFGLSFPTEEEVASSSDESLPPYCII